MGQMILRDLLIVFFVSIPVVMALKKLHVPTVIGFIVTGAIIGPQGLGWISNKESIDMMAELGVALLLFSVGLEFSMRSFMRARRQIITAGLLQILLTLGFGILIGYLLEWPIYLGVYFGCLMALSSTAVVMTLFHERALMDSGPARLSIGILILQDLALVPMMILLQFFGGDGATTWQANAMSALQAILITAVAFVLARRFIGRIIHQIALTLSRELFIVTVIVIALGTSWLTSYMGLSFALGAFLSGIIIGGTDYKYQTISEIAPFRYAFNTLFFISIGMLINFQFIADNFFLILLFALIIPMLKIIITTGVGYVVGIPLIPALVMGLYLGQIGEFSFLLAYIGRQSGAVTDYFYQLIVSTIVIAMMLTPLMVTHAHRVASFIASLPLIGRLFRARASVVNLIEEQTRDLSNHVIICGFGPLGEAFGNILTSHKIPFLVLELNPVTIDRVRLENPHTYFGDGASEEILFKSGIHHARLLAITVPDYVNNAAIIRLAKKLNPDIFIVTRAKYRNQVSKLYEIGANVVIAEEVEGGYEMGRHVLKEIGLKEEEVDKHIEKLRAFRANDESFG